MSSNRSNKERWLNLSMSGLIRFLRHRFDLNEDQEDQQEVVSNICRSVDFKGTNLWVLMFAIVVASVGLNMNSTAVVIGAMLISPLMGPIMGVGLSLGINDFELFKRSIRNFLFSVAVSVLVSTLYFMISPLNIVQSELLARTTPTIWDVLIATFGGLAGIVAQTRRDRTSTVIPGVAIATALMPPLCTAGFGLATGEWRYFAGALYLFFINAVFIAFAAFFIVRFLKFKKVEFLDSARAKRVSRLMAVILVITIVPSLLMAYGIVQRTIFETAAKNFVEKVFVFKGSEVVNYSIEYAANDTTNIIEVIMMGEPLSSDAIEFAQNQLPTYSLDGTILKVRQANKDDKMDNATLTSVLRSNAQIIDEKNIEIADLREQLEKYSKDTLPDREIARELSSLWDDIESVELSRATVLSSSGDQIGDRVVCKLDLSEGKQMSEDDARRVQKWLEVRTKHKSVRLVVDTKQSSELIDTVATARGVLLVE